jgi:hypothetical protein
MPDGPGHPKNTERPAVFDVIPILEAWSRDAARVHDTFYAKDGGSLGIWRQWTPLTQGHNEGSPLEPG